MISIIFVARHRSLSLQSGVAALPELLNYRCRLPASISLFKKTCFMILLSVIRYSHQLKSSHKFFKYIKVNGRKKFPNLSNCWSMYSRTVPQQSESSMASPAVTQASCWRSGESAGESPGPWSEDRSEMLRRENPAGWTCPGHSLRLPSG